MEQLKWLGSEYDRLRILSAWRKEKDRHQWLINDLEYRIRELENAG